ncbi:ribosomal protein L5 [Terfezia boudieri ATCC MYA-4762]|uniref:Ribosomal protein L5 n=1 Tax=Terfezia boudieri ATCC MYA-4762 TaxID=1051890 RepID=A0A3N4MB68_9PEZI|nr:ribosomal protein L5 [Terfezia boudieri ATCC MYA-4762]
MASKSFAAVLLRSCIRPSPSLSSPLPFSIPTISPSPVRSISKSALARRKTREQKSQTTPAGYQYRPPRYYLGPLNPVQPPPPSSPFSREFIPGPFTSERLHDHYHNTIAPDLLALTYDHLPHDYTPKAKHPRLRPWDDASPYYKNRPLRGPRGGNTLRLLTPPRTFKNIPQLTSITVHSMVKGALVDPDYIAVAGMAIQVITGVRSTVCYAKAHIAPWGLRENKPVAVKATIRGMQAWRFLASCIDVVLPRIKDYKGVKGSTGDGSGNLMFGFTPAEMALFPEIEVNYDMYPPKMIPGCHVTVHTSATNDRDARLLLTSFGVPFYGRLVD